MKAHFVLILLLCAVAFRSAEAQTCNTPPRADVRINEVQYAVNSHTLFANFLELSGTPGTSLSCFYLLSLDTDCTVRAALNLNSYSLNGSGYLVISEDSAKFLSLYGSAPAVVSSAVAAGDVPGGFQVVYGPAATAVGTSCGNVGGTVFDLLGYADSEGNSANTFSGEGTEVLPGMYPEAGGSMYRKSNQDTNDNSVDFVVSCQADATPGSANSGDPACPLVELTPKSLTFGPSPQSVTLTNTGTEPLSILDISISAGFGQTNDCPSQLAPSDSCDFTVSFTGSGAASGSLSIIADDSTANHSVSLDAAGASCVFCDDFEDEDVSDWIPKKSAWIAANGEVTTTLTSKGDFASPNFGGCTNCSFEAQVKVTAGGRISLFAWYETSKKSVEIALMQDKQKLLVKQKTGLISAKGAASMPIAAGVVYTVRATFDGTKIHVFVDGVEKVSFNAVGTPFGNAMFRVKSPSGVSVTGTVLEINVQ